MDTPVGAGERHLAQGQVLSPPASLQLSMAGPRPVTASWHLERSGVSPRGSGSTA